MAIVVKVGQVWQNDYTKKKHKITKITGSLVYTIPVEDTDLRNEESFGYLLQSGAPDSWESWKLVSEAPQEVVSLKSHSSQSADSKDEMSFFKTVSTPGNCPCNMPKVACEYHR